MFLEGVFRRGSLELGGGARRHVLNMISRRLRPRERDIKRPFMFPCQFLLGLHGLEDFWAEGGGL